MGLEAPRIGSASTSYSWAHYCCGHCWLNCAMDICDGKDFHDCDHDYAHDYAHALDYFIYKYFWQNESAFGQFDSGGGGDGEVVGIESDGVAIHG